MGLYCSFCNLASFTHYYLGVHPCCMYQQFIPFYFWVVLYYIVIPQFVLFCLILKRQIQLFKVWGPSWYFAFWQLEKVQNAQPSLGRSRRTVLSLSSRKWVTRKRGLDCADLCFSCFWTSYWWAVNQVLASSYRPITVPFDLGNIVIPPSLWASPEGQQLLKNPPANAGVARDTGSIPGLGRSPGVENGTPLQYSCLENPMNRGAWWATVHGVAKSQTTTKHTCLHTWSLQGPQEPLWMQKSEDAQVPCVKWCNIMSTVRAPYLLLILGCGGANSSKEKRQCQKSVVWGLCHHLLVPDPATSVHIVFTSLLGFHCLNSDLFYSVIHGSFSSLSWLQFVLSFWAELWAVRNSDLSSLTRDWTLAPCLGSKES